MLLRAFQMLPTQADDDDLEDWLHYVVDSLQFSGVRVACDEIDVDQVSFRPPSNKAIVCFAYRN
jgi:separase